MKSYLQCKKIISTSVNQFMVISLDTRVLNLVNCVNEKQYIYKVVTLLQDLVCRT